MSRAGLFRVLSSISSCAAAEKGSINNHKHPQHRERLSPATGQCCCGCCKKRNGLCPRQQQGCPESSWLQPPALLCQIENTLGLSRLDNRTRCGAPHFWLCCRSSHVWSCAGSQECCAYKWGPASALLSRDWDRNERKIQAGRQTPCTWQMCSSDISRACAPMPLAGTHLCNKPLFLQWDTAKVLWEKQ